MSGSLVLLHLAGAVALLLWATRMVRTGVQRAYGDVLRRRLRSTLQNPMLALLAGAGLAIALQSATAVALLVGSFAGLGIVAGASGLIAVLGADIGSALVVRILSFDISLLAPVCLLVGVVIFLSTEHRAWRQLGRILVGVGLLLLSLRLIGQASEPLRDSELLPVITGYLSSDPATAFLLAAIVTWLFHSSVAAVLLVASLAARGLVPADLGVVLVLGANLGAGFVAAILSRSLPPRARAVPLGNLILRGAGAVLALIAFVWWQPPLALLGGSASAQAVHVHIVFNAALALLALPLARPVNRAAEALVAHMAPADRGVEAAAEMTALDPSVLDTPALALANATREVVRICETVEVMLAEIIELYEEPESERVAALAALDDRVDSRHAAIKLYLAQIGPMNDVESQRCQELLGACVRLEQVGDIIVHNLLHHVEKKRKRGLVFTREGWNELVDFHAAVMANARLAFNVLVSRDADMALRLVREKDRLRERERQSSAHHFARLQKGKEKSIETSSIHLDTIRDLKQINSLLAAIAYPVLKEQGLLRESRLVVE